MIYLASYVCTYKIYFSCSCVYIAVGSVVNYFASYRDAERKKRVQEIYSLLQTQQAEAKREKREKK